MAKYPKGDKKNLEIKEPGKVLKNAGRRGTSDGYMTNAKKLTVKSEDKENKIKINKK